MDRTERDVREAQPPEEAQYEAPAAEDIDVGNGPAVTAPAVIQSQPTNVSDRALKERIDDVDVDAVLAGVVRTPISRWSYKDEPAVRHIGPMAQDFAAAFAVGHDDRHIHNVDANGVALAAIQALQRRLDTQAREIETLRAELERRNQG